MADVSFRLLVLKTHDIAALCGFYETLGFDFAEERHGSGPLHYSAPLGDGIIEIYPLQIAQPVDTATRLGFAVVDPDSVVAAAENHGGRVIKPGRDTRWGYMALVEDCDGRTVELYRA